jgi:hypothetical protein
MIRTSVGVVMVDGNEGADGSSKVGCEARTDSNGK